MDFTSFSCTSAHTHQWRLRINLPFYHRNNTVVFPLLQQSVFPLLQQSVFSFSARICIYSFTRTCMFLIQQSVFFFLKIYIFSSTTYMIYILHNNLCFSSTRICIFPFSHFLFNKNLYFLF